MVPDACYDDGVPDVFSGVPRFGRRLKTSPKKTDLDEK